MQSFISGIGCNRLVALAVWLSYGSDQISGKIWLCNLAGGALFVGGAYRTAYLKGAPK